jgi:stalled ribosome rescue protein Dom34
LAKVARIRTHKRGYPVALLAGLEDDRAVIWQIFSHVVKLHVTVKLAGSRTDERALFNFHESIIHALRPALNEGIRSLVVTAPVRTTYAADFLKHVQKHHTYLIQSKTPNRATFAQLVGSAVQLHDVAQLVKTTEFQKLITETTSGEADNIILALEKQIYDAKGSSVVLYSLKEIEDKIYTKEKSNNFKSEFLLLTDKYVAESKNKNRIHRLLQVAKNKKVKTRIISTETPAGKRISQFGGIVFFNPTTKKPVPLHCCAGS